MVLPVIKCGVGTSSASFSSLAFHGSILSSRCLGLGSNPLILTLFFYPTTIPFPLQLKNQDLFYSI